ncbi:endonuclease [Sphingomonas paeninsulae]|uniref:Endonuclease n=1 Tax=Sphingomonas paeninsulae TaxID=2319844 RepID=A0A494TJS6_SPHPE|nr:YqaJ viral recombinase family protein [Sphingomonas paeninsulae]AYJ87632.1 endonuclease [Sphingomonas paeninsulae]
MATQLKAVEQDDAAFRASVVGASEVAALFGASPWLTEFELYHRKTGAIATPEFNAVDANNVPENERSYWGVKLEPLIIEAACERWGYVPLKTPHRLDNGKGLGGHPDCIATCPERGKGILEVKMVDWLQVKKWGYEPPLNYLLQNMSYQGLSGALWGDMIVLVGGNELRRYQYDFRPLVYADIERRVEQFWQAIRAGDAPVPDFERDGRAITELLGVPTEEVADLRGDNEASDLADEWQAAKAEAKAADVRAETAKNALMMKIGSAGYAMLPLHKVSCSQTKGAAGTLITEAHVGTHIGARKGWRQFSVKEAN